jgi:hypothetical protein
MLAFQPFAQQAIGFDTRSAVKAGYSGSMPATTSLLDSAADAILAGHEGESQVVPLPLISKYEQCMT